MKKALIFGLVVVVLLFVVINFTKLGKVSAATGLILAGQVSCTPQCDDEEAICPGVSFTMHDPIRGDTGPYYTIDITKGTPVVDGYVLGTYVTTQGPCCIPTPEGCDPITTQSIIIYAASKKPESKKKSDSGPVPYQSRPSF